MAEFNFGILPEEIWLEIFSYLPLSDLRRIRFVSKDFNGLVDEKFMDNVKLAINDENIKAIRKNFANRKNKLSVKYLEFKGVSSMEDVQFILQTIGDQVEGLSLYNSAIFEYIETYVRNLKSLTLKLGNVEIERVYMDYLNIGEFTALEELNLIDHWWWSPDVTDMLLSQLVEGPGTNLRLKRLMIHNTTQNEDEIYNILMLHSATLEFLKIKFLRVDDDDIDVWKNVFSRLTNLKTLNMRASPGFLNIAVTELPRGVKLENIELRSMYCGNTVKLAAIIAARWKKSLKALGLFYCSMADDNMGVFQNMPKLRYLQINNCRQISGKGILNGFAAKHNPIIQELHLIGLPKLTELDLCTILTRLPNLRVLKIEELSNAITNNSLAHIFRYQTRLRVLSLYGSCDNITDDGFIGFGDSPCPINRLRGLEKLVLTVNSNISDRTFIEGFSFAELRVLDLKACNGVTMKGIQALINNCPVIEVLDISGKNITNDVLLAIRNGFKRLHALNFTKKGDIYEMLNEMF